MKRALRVALVALLSACSGAKPRAGVTSLQAAQVIRWALGSEHRTPRPPNADALLLVAPVGQKPAMEAPVTTGCVAAESFLPAPEGDQRIFFLVKGGLYVKPADGQTPRLLEGNNPALTIERLLAWKAAASPLQVLVSARPHGAGSQEIWVISVGAQKIEHEWLAAFDRMFADQDAFFEAYRSPRCLPGGRRCLVLGADDEQSSYLEVEPLRGKAAEPLSELGPIKVRDVAWASGDGSSIYFLVDCPAR